LSGNLLEKHETGLLLFNQFFYSGVTELLSFVIRVVIVVNFDRRVPVKREWGRNVS
jgi:hypothetical protein